MPEGALAIDSVEIYNTGNISSSYYDGSTCTCAAKGTISLLTSTNQFSIANVQKSGTILTKGSTSGSSTYAGIWEANVGGYMFTTYYLFPCQYVISSYLSKIVFTVNRSYGSCIRQLESLSDSESVTGSNISGAYLYAKISYI